MSGNKPCKQCGKEFTPYNKRAKYCGSRCRRAAKTDLQRKACPPAVKVMKRCRACDTAFFGTAGRKFCQDRCRELWYSTRRFIKERDCPVCGDRYQPIDMNYTHCNGRNCKDGRHDKEGHRAATIDFQTIILTLLNDGYLDIKKHFLQCEVCGKDFLSTIKHTKVCSDKCRRVRYKEYLAKHRKPARTRNCPTCNKEFPLRNLTSIFCSTVCREKYDPNE